MSEVLTIKQMPAELKQYWAEEAKRHGRSMNKEDFVAMAWTGNIRHVVGPHGLGDEAADGRRSELLLTLRIDTPITVDYYGHGGILPFVLRQLLAN
ncbi:MAG: hypothetical protein LH632_04205 [Rhodoferax sp.]|nr:hypothetical protein [Rhodoferax sp.]